ncbi:MAG: hypothetical protein AABZ30_15025 [Myxococcota bacterium]
MRRHRLALSLVVAAAAAGCLADENPTSLIITGLVPSAEGEGPLGCAIPLGTATVLVARGHTDVLLAQFAKPLGFAPLYWGHVVLQNNLSSPRPENDYIKLTKFEIDLAYGFQAEDAGYNPEVAAAVADWSAFAVPFGAVISPSQAFTAMGVTLLPYGLMRQMADTLGCGAPPCSPEERDIQDHLIIATIRAVGSLRGSDIESSTLEFPIDVCKGCMTRGVIPGDATRCGEFDGTTLDQGDPCTGLPIEQNVACCWQPGEGERIDRLVCPCSDCPTL